MADGPKRFYKDVSLIPHEGSFAIGLDGRPAKTVGRATLAANQALAEVIAGEWSAQEEVINLEAMPLTRLHGFVLDAGDEGKGQFIDTILQYAASDLLCYRADDSQTASRQQAVFRPFMELAAADGLAFEVTSGILPVDQPAETLDALRSRLSEAGLGEIYPRKLLTEITGSAILALYADQQPDAAFQAARIDETVQAEKWGEDAEALAREQALRRDFDATLTYLALQSA